jgi:CubicO group peptidase (beta-lactamase class C family)
MIYTKQNLKYCTFKVESDYAAWRDDLAAQGFRTISLSLAQLVGNVPRVYTAVMVKLPTPFAGRSFPLLTRAQLEAKVTEMAAQSPALHPYIVSATGSGIGARYAAAFRHMNPATELQPALTESQYKDAVAARREAGEIPVWIDSFGTASSPRLCVVWQKNLDLIAWNAEALNDKGDARQQRFEAVVSVGGRPTHLAITPDGGYARLFVDNQLKGGWKSRPAKSVSEFETEANAMAKEGFFPVHIASGLISGDLALSAIYAHSDEIVPRTFRKTGADLGGLTAANRDKAKKIDDWMEAYLTGHNMRGGAVAIVKGTRLVFARGYTWAESGMTDVEPTTLFRLASVSKTYCAVAAWKALLDSTAHHRDSKMQAILTLKQRNGQAPKDPDFASIKVRNLLENNSGINQFLYRGIMKDLRDSTETPKPAQPVPISKLLSMIAERDMDHDPGDQREYGKTDYILLGEVAKKVSGAASFDAALKKLVLDPLKMTRTRTSRSRIEDRAADEALHQTKTIDTSPSAVHTDRRIVAGQYGGENYEVFDGAGGISSAVVDLARLCAMFSCRTGNPVLPANVLRSMLEEAVAAQKAQGGHANHGFDSASGSEPSFTLEKGGGLPGAGSGYQGTTGGTFVVILRNGEKEESAPEDWKTALRDLANAVNWGKQDLFPQYDMPTLSP